MSLRKCQKCGEVLGVDKFSPNKERKDGLCVWCKQCNREAMQRWRAEKRKTGELKFYRRKYYLKELSGENGERLKRKDLARFAKNRKDWRTWFKEIYGKHPVCQICGIEVQWKRWLADTLCFDHRNGGKEAIKINPSEWCRGYQCSEKNKEIWLSCDFGILCNRCSAGLCTKNRLEWVEKTLDKAQILKEPDRKVMRIEWLKKALKYAEATA